MRAALLTTLCLVLSFQTAALAQAPPDDAVRNPRLAALRISGNTQPAPQPRVDLGELGAVTRYLHFGTQISVGAMMMGQGQAQDARRIASRWLAARSELAGLSPAMAQVAWSLTSGVADGRLSDDLWAGLDPSAVRNSADLHFVLGIWVGMASLSEGVDASTRRQLAGAGDAYADRNELDPTQRAAVRQIASGLRAGDVARVKAGADALVDHTR